MKKKTIKLSNSFLVDVFGWYGTIAIVGAYALTNFSVISVNSSLYIWLNITGSLGLIGISLVKKTYQSVVLNVIWVTIALLSLMKNLH